jgi:mycothiol synthase
VTTEALTRVDPSEFGARREAILALESAARAESGHESLGERAWRDLAHPAPDSAGFFVEGRAYVHVWREDVGDGSTWSAGVVRRPKAHRGALQELTRALLDAAVEHVTRHHGLTLTCWVFGVTAGDDATFAAASFEPAHTLYEMRMPLPIAEAPRWPGGVEVRSFVPGRDEAAWLAVNNRAFAGHPDQGGWHESTLQARLAEPWFDPHLFLLAFDTEGLLGFNWLKLHAANEPGQSVGEIYVIGVDPRAQGSGLGRALAVAGLEALHARGATTGMLFCAADNAGALALYRSLGFGVHRTDRSYVRQIGVRRIGANESEPA